MIFDDRRSAGQRLAQDLSHYRGRPGLLVLGLPRGGVPVAFEVARALGAPLDVFIVRKLGVPGHPEYAMGALASGGVRVMNDEVVAALAISPAAIERVVDAELQELERRERAYRGERPPLQLRQAIVILVDDGLATGASMRAAVRAVRAQQPARIVVAVPVAAADACRALAREADEVVATSMPSPFHGVGLWYRDFSQTGDAEVRRLLQSAPATRRRGEELRSAGHG